MAFCLNTLTEHNGMDMLKVKLHFTLNLPRYSRNAKHNKEICGPHDTLTSPREITVVGHIRIQNVSNTHTSGKMASVRISKAGDKDSITTILQ
jgi:hypothetical protein